MGWLINMVVMEQGKVHREEEEEEEGLCVSALPLSHNASWLAGDGPSPPPSSSLRPGTFFSSCYLEKKEGFWVKDPSSAPPP